MPKFPTKFNLIPIYIILRISSVYVVSAEENWKSGKDILFIMDRGEFTQSYYRNVSDFSLNNKDSKDFTQELAMVFSGEKDNFGQTFGIGLLHDSYNNHAYYFVIQSKDTLFRWLRMIANRVCQPNWYPLILFLWPDQITPQKDNSSHIHWREQIRTILSTEVAPLFNPNVDIRNTIYFVFKVDVRRNMNDYNVRRSVWEVYYITGYGTDQSKLVIQEIFQNREWISSPVTRRGNLRQIRLSVVAPLVFDTVSELEWKETVNGSWELEGGYGLEILQDLRDAMNFRFLIIEGDWLGRATDGSITGISANLLREHLVDLMLGQSVPVANRTTLLNYLHPTSHHALRIYYQQPAASSFKNIITTVIQPPLLIFAMSTYLLVAISVYAISQMLTKHFTNCIQKCHYVCYNECCDLCLFGETFIWLIGSMAQQGPRKFPRCSTLRIVFISMMLTANVFYMSYQAVIVSVLSVENVPIKNLSQLFSNDTPLYASDDSVILSQYLRSVMQEEKSHKMINYIPVNSGVQLVFNRGELTSYIVYAHQFHHEVQEQKIPDYVICDIIWSFPLTNVPLPSAMGVPKKSPYRKFFNHKILGMAERGLLSRYKKHRDVANGITCLQEVTRYRSHLGIHDILTSMLILSIGFTFCLVFLLFEYIYVKNIGIIKLFLWLYWKTH